MIRPLRPLAALLLAIGLCAAPAAAETVPLPHTLLEVPLPEDYCSLDPGDPIEAEVMRVVEALQQGQNRVLLQLVQCEELAQWRSGELLEFMRFGHVMLPMANGAVQPVPLDRASFLGEMVNHLPAADDALIEEIRRTANNNEQGFTVEDLQYLGLLDQDANGLYVGLIGRPAVDGEAGGLQAGLMGMTLVRQTIVAVYFYRPFEDQADFDRLMVLQKAYMERLIAANP